MTLNTNGIASDVAGKRILITGGASGIGAASALLLASRGAKVVIGDMAEEMGEAVAKQGQDAGNSIVFKKVDVTSGDEVRALFDFAVETLGGLDVVVNNAGIDHKPSPMHELSDDDFDRNIAVNLKGVWHCMRAAVNCMIPNGGGHVINVASIAGLRSAPMISAYSAAKHGVMGLTKSAAHEYARANIRFNAVCPSFIDTPMVRNTMATMDERTQQATIKASPLRRLGNVSEISSAIAWLASDESSFMNGHAFTLDGGMLA
ncbi:MULTISPECIES: SDR family NAD(P)-dependent oxidoreductase [Psychrobacter]|jgi:NAD(P)-dependent dehydrogenase (short-subunit alcohol dehydrogenase family)|uniref:Oxidoreductase, short-chain dehydrogenase/reductase family n=1 Tax=Psychrobacter nivimaris TaxID=281738 RepID=A0A6N7BZ16_9GAMM|nr:MULTISPECIES: SDR family NAD(P)-dependent oxidoreductase [Psychrobacter]KAF0569638.1 Oxidoreductase, short-chain dehydrogenase/reductase family [Psychrobacter nivimaris]MDN3446738.1 SDR family NAD(P)-dependent oxidoreductase [Psychrobacter sp. APC 3281]NYR10178.1 SDR family oxidoreductase [Psychrobacter sp. BI730]OEH66961.1 MAG: oxidoreductase [Psychrobacter sp. B29-1]PKG62523.1 oxidoreductase [Psychrobacter sp. Choline-02u-13]|tara:strand:- start:341 stop:1123 length:783 start_codon:yes stop_codon:yes gene_type:complete